MKWYVLAFVLCVFITDCVGQSCVRVRPGEEGLFYSNPTIPSPDLTACNLQTEEACCTSAYTDQIVSGTDPISTNIYDLYTGISAKCDATFSQLKCLYCYRIQGDYISPLPAAYDKVSLCDNFCNRLLSDCKAARAKDSNKRLDELFETGKEFCESAGFWASFFVDIVHPESTQPCFDPEDIKAACQVEDYEGIYTSCSAGGTRDLIYTWKDDADCKGGVQLPPPKTNLPCTKSCGPGQYLPLGETECKNCLPGTYSIGGGLRASYWSEWPTDPNVFFSTSCKGTNDQTVACHGWELDHDFVRSGKNPGINSIVSTLTARFTLVRDGFIQFRVKVDSEKHFDKLSISIGSDVSEVIHSGPEYVTKKYNLDAGPYEFKWEYIKDATQSIGQDAAFISEVEINGLRYADDECAVCPPGEFSNSVGAARCSECGFNQVPAGTPPSSCVDCTAEQFALPGDRECVTRAPCTMDDYVEDFTECRSPGVRDKYYKWKEPKICSDTAQGSVQLPARQTGLECARCRPGQFRDNRDYQCKYCPDGHASEITDANMDVFECTKCNPGTYAPKAVIYNKFPDEWPANWGTDCDSCDSEGFRLHYDYIDSGSSNGNRAFSSYLYINETYGKFGGHAEVDITFHCPAENCFLALWLDDEVVTLILPEDSDSTLTLATDVPTEGKHSVVVDFSTYSLLSNPDAPAGYIIITSVRIHGTVNGGAPTCDVCEPGFESLQAGATECTQCKPGEATSTGTCTACAVDSVVDVAGAGECWECGTGTTTNGQTGQTECDNNGCKYTTADGKIDYDISALTRLDAMWGPVYDRESGHQYYINVCTNDHAEHTCHYADGSIMPTFACQVTTEGDSMDLGRILGFAEDGGDILLTYAHGTECVVGNRTIERSSFIRFICDPTVEDGFPVAPGQGIESATCVYEFDWYTLYGCPICSKNDYEFYYTPCEGDTRWKEYKWKTNPKRCHGGIALPERQSVPCGTTNPVVCNDGEKISAENENCTKCEAGTYSVGGGELVDYWDDNTEGFLAYCETDGRPENGVCGGSWVSKGVIIETNGHLKTNEAAVLFAERNFKRAGFIQFKFSIITENFEPLLFYVDDQLVKSWNTTTLKHESAFKHPVGEGTHTFKWKFSTFQHGIRERKTAAISSIKFHGTRWTEYRCNECIGDRISGEGAAKCEYCGLHQYYVNPTKCGECAPQEFSLVGDSNCHSRSPCIAEDYRPVSSPCIDGKQTITYELITPSLCVDGSGKPQSRTIDCESCRDGFYRVDDECQICATGRHWDPTLKDCVAALPGTTSMHVETFFAAKQGARYDSFPEHWKTGCAGVCSSNGWRALGTSMDSGVNYEQAFSWISFTETFTTDGSITFTTNLESHFTKRAVDYEYVALEFFIDGETRHLAVQEKHENVRYTVPSGTHTFTFVHRQELADPSGYIRSIVSDLQLYGTKNGGTVEVVCPAGYTSDGAGTPCHKCPAGHFANQPNAASCEPCPSGTYAMGKGNTECKTCGENTHANEHIGATDCTNTCSFSAMVPGPNAVSEEFEWDFSALRHRQITLKTSDANVNFVFTVCNRMLPHVSPCNLETYVCEEDENTHDMHNAGEVVGYHATDISGFTSTFSEGSTEDCVNGIARITKVVWVCDENSKPYSDVRLILPDDEEGYLQGCEFEAVVKSVYACPRCRAEDMIRREGECIDGYRMIEYVSSVPCWDGKPTDTEQCEDVEVNEFVILFVLLLVLLVVGVLAGCAVYLYRQKANVDKKYNALILGNSGDNDSMEMGPVGSLKLDSDNSDEDDAGNTDDDSS